MKRMRTLFWFAGVVLLLGGTLLWTLKGEPRHQGRSLTSWLVKLESGSPEEKAAAEEAVRKIGGRAIPHLLRFLSYETTDWKQRVSMALENLPLEWFHAPDRWMDPGKLQHRGILGFRTLGTDAASAIPVLSLHLTNGPHNGNAAFALAAIGPETIPILIRSLESQYAQARLCSVWALGSLGPQAKEAVPSLLKLMEKEPGISRFILDELTEIEPSTAEEMGQATRE
jgi:hypothetical protein